MRRVPPTIFPSPPAAVWRAAFAPADPGALRVVRTEAEEALRRHFGRSVLALLDSGTAALTLALRSIARHSTRPAGPLRVAVPAFGCIDVPTAVMGAGATAVGYDLDPATLAPDDASLHTVLDGGVDAVIVSHLFGHPVALHGWRGECDRRGVVLIEDAAQWAGARWRDQPLGAQGHLTVLSLGRGKGLVGTGGGVLLGGEPLGGELLDGELLGDGDAASRQALVCAGRLGTVLRATVAALLGRPALYGIPAAIPALHLGEMVFHPPRPPRPMSLLSARLLPDALARAEEARTVRTQLAHRYLAAVRVRGVATPPIVPEEATPGVLRQAFLLDTDRPVPAHLGVVRPYPRPLSAQVEVAAVVRPGPPTPGAELLAARLVTLPVHDRVSESDASRLCAWIGGTSTS